MFGYYICRLLARTLHIILKISFQNVTELLNDFGILYNKFDFIWFILTR